MIRFTSGNLLEARADALVNTVNEVGVMGKGIALMFRDAFPHNTEQYELVAKAHGITVGKMFITENPEYAGPRWIINFPTKKHWRQPSRWSGLETASPIWRWLSPTAESSLSRSRRSDAATEGWTGQRSDTRSCVL